MKWHNIKDKMPPDEELVLIVVRDYGMTIITDYYRVAFHRGDCFYDSSSPFCYLDNPNPISGEVVAWSRFKKYEGSVR